VPVSKHDREYMARLAEASAVLERETGPASAEHRQWVIEHANRDRARIGLPPLEDWDADDAPELEFFRRARELGMLPRRQSAS
jgi:hypothetical protein